MNLSFILSVDAFRPHRGTRPPTSVARGRGRLIERRCSCSSSSSGSSACRNTLLTFAVYTVLLKVFGVWYLAASAIGFVVGATNGFLLNRRWTFREPRRRCVHAGALGDRAGLRARRQRGCCCIVLVHDAQPRQAGGPGCATAVVTVATFFANRAWTFRVHDRASAAVRRDAEARSAAERRLSSRATRLAEDGQQRQARRGCARRGRSAPPRARAGARAAS